VSDGQQKTGNGSAPSPNGANGDGRDDRGRFAAGNAGGPGNPHAGAVAKLRSALFAALKPTHVRKAVKMVLAILDDPKAKAADKLAAAKLVHEWGLGTQADLKERIERVEQMVLK